MWQKLYEELGDEGFVVIAVALDTAGAAAAGEWIRAANPTYPALIDERHVVAELYNMVNVPNAVWIDEAGRVVRPAEAAGSSDSFRKMDRATFQVPEEAREMQRRSRAVYLDAIRDWVRRGAASPHALAPEAARARAGAITAEQAEAATYFRLAVELHEQGRGEAAERAFAEAKRLRPESWAYKRQAWSLEAPGKAGGPEFWAAVDALGDRPYYPPVDMEGMPSASPP